MPITHSDVASQRGQNRPHLPGHSIPDKGTQQTGSSRKSKLEAIRVPTTVIGAVLWLLAAGTAGSFWGEQSAVGLTMFAAGCILTTLGAAGRIWCLAYISGHKSSSLITEGPYAMCRNPLYLFSLLAAIGVGLGSGTFSLPLVAVVGFAVYYPGVIRAEERRLGDLFGEAYQIYAQTVPSFFPTFRNSTKREQHTEIDINSFSSGLGDSIWFFLAFGGMHLLAELHNGGLLHSLWTLP